MLSRKVLPTMAIIVSLTIESQLMFSVEFSPLALSITVLSTTAFSMVMLSSTTLPTMLLNENTVNFESKQLGLLSKIF